MSDDDSEQWGRTTVLTEGPFKGWRTWAGPDGDPFETYIGPLCYKVEEDGRVRCAFEPQQHHLNGGGFLHGGALMSFADFSLFAIAANAIKGASSVTLTMNSEFIGAGKLGAWVEAEGEVLKETRALVFVRGVLKQEGKVIFAYSGTLKKIGK